MVSCIFTEEKLQFGHFAIKPRLVECRSDVCPSLSFSHLHIRSWSSTRVTISVLITSNQDPSPSIAQFGQEARSRKSPDCFKLHPLRIMKAKCSCEPSSQHNFFVVFPRSVSTQSCLSALQAIPLTSWLCFCSDILFSC